MQYSQNAADPAVRPQYISQLNAFHRFTEANYLPMTAQLLWFKLIDLCNRCGWQEWVQLDTLRMMAMLDVKNQNAAFRARDALVGAGLLEYEKGRKGCPNRYRLRYFPCSFDTENASENACENACPSEAETYDIIRQDKDKDKTRQDKPRVPAELHEVFGAYAEMRKKMRKPLTDPASQLVLRTLDTLAPDRPQQQRKILEQSILNGWAGIYPLKEEAPETPASYDVGEIERRLLFGKIEYKKRE